MTPPNAQSVCLPELLAAATALSREEALARDTNPICLRAVYMRDDAMSFVPADTLKLAPFSPTKGTGTDTLPSVKVLLKFFAEGTDETPPPSIHCLAKDPFNLESRQLLPFNELPHGPHVRLAPSTHSIEQAPTELLPSSGPIRTPHTHLVPVVADYTRLSTQGTKDAPSKLARLLAKASKDATNIAHRHKSDHTTNKRRFKLEQNCLALPPAIKAIPTELTKKFIPEWPWDFYACDIKAGLELYDAQVEHRLRVPTEERQKLISEIFDEAHPGVGGGFKTWLERLNEPHARDLLDKYAKLGRVEEATFIEYDRARRGDSMFNVSRLSSGYRVLRGSNDFGRRENRIRASVALQPEECKSFRLLACDTKPQDLNGEYSPIAPDNITLDETAQPEMIGEGNESDSMLIQ